MHTTSISLLDRLRQPGDQGATWARFVQLYTPLLYHWARKLGVPPADAGDLIQEVLTLLVQKLPAFAYQPGRSFRAWLRTVTLNKWRDLRRRHMLGPKSVGTELGELEAPDETAAIEDCEYRVHLVQRALQLLRNEFTAMTWKACWECVVVDRPASEVAQELGITINAVYLAKSRVLSRLREELDGLLE
jgi:RNA polymerase sigma-70 factor (ECF subfamily)